MISAVVIAKNEEEMIADCLSSLKFCDEIVLVDDGSTDDTVKIASKFTNKIFENTRGSIGYVEAVRKFAVSKASGEWVLIIDADERVSTELAKDILSNITSAGELKAFKIIRRNYYLGKNLWPQEDILLRLFRKSEIENWDWKLHTSPEVKGEVGELKGYLDHYTHRNLSQMLDKTIEWSKEEAKLRYEAGHPKMNLLRFARPVISSFFNSYVKQKGYRVGTAGIVESIYQAFSSFITYARLWELQINGTKPSKEIDSRA